MLLVASLITFASFSHASEMEKEIFFQHFWYASSSKEIDFLRVPVDKTFVLTDITQLVPFSTSGLPICSFYIIQDGMKNAHAYLTVTWDYTAVSAGTDYHWTTGIPFPAGSSVQFLIGPLYEGDKCEGVRGNVNGYLINSNPSPSTTTYPLTLTAGWNLFSTPLNLTDPSPSGLIKDFRDKVRIIWGWDKGVWKAYRPEGPIPVAPLSTIEPGKGYWIYMNEDVAVQVEGTTP